jgi:hypothetical protein
MVFTLKKTNTKFMNAKKCGIPCKTRYLRKKLKKFFKKVLTSGAQSDIISM